MRYRLFFVPLFCALVLALSLVPRHSTAQDQPSDGRPDEVTLAPPQGQQLAQIGANYLSPPTAAAHPFTHMLIRRDAQVPNGAGLTLFVRASTDGNSWTDWAEVQENDDLWQPSDGPDVAWSETVDVGGTAAFWQVRADFSAAPDGARPDLRDIRVSTVNAEGFAPAAAPAPQLSAIGKPAVVSRTAWGCPDGEGSRAKPDYYPVNHMVVHHTADSSTLLRGEPDWSARVRAEWSFHTYTRGWGDVGYNYLIDPNGVVYEGRAGGDNAVGFHDRANYGSMGVVLIGTYTSTPPTQAAQNSLVNLLAWKAGQRDIDPTGRSVYYGCTISKYCYPYNTGGVVVNIAGHRDIIPGQTTCPGQAAWDILPTIRSRVKDALGGAPPPPQGRAEISGVRYDRAELASGELLKVSITVKNTGTDVLRGQDPRVDELNNGPDPLNDGYVYDQGECFAGNASGSYPVYPKETNRTRVVLGWAGWDSQNGGSCQAPTGDYPWRWGLNHDLQPGQSETIVGYVRFREKGSYNLRANVIQEYVGYFYNETQGIGAQTVTVTDEHMPPQSAAYGTQLQPLAYVYRLGAIPDNFLARTANPLSIPRGEFVGSFGWDGATLNMGAGGPPVANAPTDMFMIQQTRSFVAPVSGEYTFRTTSDDGSWLWVDGRPVVVNNGLHPATDEDGTVQLEAGVHSVSFQYFDRTGDAVAGYAMRSPGAEAFVVPPDGLGGGAFRLGQTFLQYPTLVLVADDLGGSGVARIRWSWDGANWQENDGGTVTIGRLQNGNYRVRYQPIDAAGNAGDERELAFTVDTSRQVSTIGVPLATR